MCVLIISIDHRIERFVRVRIDCRISLRVLSYTYSLYLIVYRYCFSRCVRQIEMREEIMRAT